MTLAEFLRAEQFAEGGWRFGIGPEMFGAFYGAFGGVVAACALMASRTRAPGKVPVAIDCRFLRGLPAGTATAAATVLHTGRSVSVLSVDVTDDAGRLCTRATVSLVAPAALSPLDRAAREAPVFGSHDDARSWGAVAPIAETLDPRFVGAGATSLRLPWLDAGSSAEAVCFAADLCVGPPVAAGVTGERIGHPNPDLSVRFVGTAQGPEVVGVGTLERATQGVAAVGIEVWSAGELVGIGVSTSLLIPVA